MPFTTSLLALKFYKFVCFSVQKLTRETLQKKDNLISSEKKNGAAEEDFVVSLTSGTGGKRTP